jgi:hypothetical protein
MVPRAEISMIVMQRGLEMGEEVVPPDLFGAMIVVTLATSTLFPVIVGRALARKGPG